MSKDMGEDVVPAPERAAPRTLTLSEGLQCAWGSLQRLMQPRGPPGLPAHRHRCGPRTGFLHPYDRFLYQSGL